MPTIACCMSTGLSTDGAHELWVFATFVRGCPLLTASTVVHQFLIIILYNYDTFTVIKLNVVE